MSVFRKSGLVIKPGGRFHALWDQVKQVNLKPVNRVSYKLDPFHQNAKNVRDLMFYFSSPKVRETNSKCIFKTEVVCDQSEPEIVCKLENGTVLTFKAGNLLVLEILKEFNRIVLPLVPPVENLEAIIPKTKSQKRK